MASFRNIARRSLRFLGKTLVVLVMVLYVLAGYTAASAIVQRFYVRREDLSAIDLIVKDPAREGNLSKWVMARPQSETAALIAKVEPYAGQLTPFTFFNFSGRTLRQEKYEDAMFWYLLGSFRLRLDLIRCQLPPETVRAVEQAYGIELDNDGFAAYFKANPGAQDKALRRMLDFDKAHPPLYEIADFCKSADKKAFPDYWTNYRAGLRRQVEESLPPPDDAKKPEDAKKKATDSSPH